jgi:FAD/FMN-containing dehydrogenase
MYFATLGGMGMTGIILDVKLQLKKISSSYVDVETVRFNNLRELFDLIKDSWDSYSYIFSWVDSHKEGEIMGRGVLQRANHADNVSLYFSEKKRFSIPFNFPGFVINKYTVEAFNALIFAKAGLSRNKRRIFLMDYFYPLDNLAHWYRIYGKNGFLEYQVAIPKENAYEAISDILKLATKSKLGSIVAAIKPMIKSRGLLSFPIDGFTLAIDFQYNKKILQLLDELDEIVIANGGRVYLSKDSRLHAEKFNRMYSNTLSDWEKVRNDYQINKKFNSLMFNRLLKLK